MSLLRHEWRLLAADRTLIVTASLLLALMVLGLYNGWRFTHELTARQEAIAAEETARRAQLAHQAEALLQAKDDSIPAWKSPTRPFPVGNRLVQPMATLPPGPLNAFAIGQLDLLPTSFQVSLLGQVADFGQEPLDHPAHLSTGSLDLAFVLLYLLPLFVLALSFDLLSREHEDGTLRLVLVQAGSLRRWVLGRLVVRALTVLGLCALAGGAGYLVTGASGGMARLLAWMGLVAAYGAFWFALALAVNALGRGSATNALLLVSLWLLMVVVIPAAVQLGVSQLYPVPSRVALVGAARQAAAEAEKEGSQLLARYYQDHPELAPQDGKADTFLPTYLAVQSEAARRTAPVLESFQTQLTHQQQMLGALRFLSPALAFQQALQDVAGTGHSRHAHFLQQVSVFHEDWRSALLPRAFAQQVLGAEAHHGLPRFTWREQPVAEALSAAAVGLLALLLPTIAALTFGLLRLRRYPVGGSGFPASTG
ncbi:DUF3526 domain-containing protein [Hyalangium rubrum]|uniref:DUF3526 domain-containing protein n=1 Tax=Hyalangium rubrum TaxID=3103134 RepID=A0ABU5GW56_9BACT|nr:DUF3526 domain-containing protein [Hyalangium sp. s54d21]MDY7225422.1 DUF3526 domain-containing protein [Hyalangium sp. s54d21]